MRYRMTLTLLWFTILVLCITVGNSSVFAENIDPNDNGTQYAYAENVGWINFEPSYGPGVAVTDSKMSGYAWGENIGWINLNPTKGGVVNDGKGNLSAYAWGENVGWINFSPTGGGVKIDANTGEFSRKAWGENIGWISFTPEGAVTYGVSTSWEEFPWILFMPAIIKKKRE